MTSEFSENGNDNNEGFWTPFAEGAFDGLPDFSELAKNDEVPVVNPDNPLDFRQEFDGTQAEVSREDAEVARQLFDDVIAETNEAHVEHLRPFAIPNSDILFLEYRISETESVDSSIVNAGKFSFIDVDHICEGKSQSKAHYQIAKETGRIIRYDMDPLEKPPELDIDEIESSDRETVENLVSSQSNAAENLRLGDQMGVNGQEVDPTELQAVSRILEASRPDYNN